MTDPEENAIIVNALQRHAAVVAQKGLAQGFGPTVSEAMYKRRRFVASAVGGIPDQIIDGHSGVLLHDPRVLKTFSALLAILVDDPPQRRSLGEHARARIIERFLPDAQLSRWSAVVAAVLERADTTA
jgi:trehalose synthase